MGTIKKDQWISAKEAAAILTKNSGHTVTDTYVRVLAKEKKVASKPLDGRTNVYLKSDVEKIKVRTKKVADRQKAQLMIEADSSANTTVTEEQPWYMPEQKEESTSAEGKDESEAA